MKKIYALLLCLLILVGCQSDKVTVDYDDCYQQLKDVQISFGIIPSTNPNMYFIYDDEQWIFMMDEDYKVTSVFNTISNETVYGDDATESASYEKFVKDSGMSQEELNEFAGLFYEKNIDKITGE